MDKEALPAVCDEALYEYKVHPAMKTGMTALKTKQEKAFYDTITVTTVMLCILAVLSCTTTVALVLLERSAGCSIETKGSKVEYNWGNDVTIGGHSVPVLNWFDGEMKTDNIKTNLE